VEAAEIEIETVTGTEIERGSGIGRATGRETDSVRWRGNTNCGSGNGRGKKGGWAASMWAATSSYAAYAARSMDKQNIVLLHVMERAHVQMLHVGRTAVVVACLAGFLLACYLPGLAPPVVLV
jgi:hypothetical protein